MPKSLEIGQEANWHQVNKWLEECSSWIHFGCHSSGFSKFVDNLTVGFFDIPSAHEFLNVFHVPESVEPNQRPSRLISVGEIGDPYVRISKTRDSVDFSTQEYMTLSHRWGEGVPLRLLKDNQEEFCTQGIQLDRLPKTFQDAVGVTRKLKVPFLWIDSLCIIQDSHEDWVEESAKMHSIYRRSYLNISAGGARDPNGGLFFPRPMPLALANLEVPLRDRPGAPATCHLVLFPCAADEKLPLFERAWVLQERYMSLRNLIFGRYQLHWECRTFHSRETWDKLGTGPLRGSANMSRFWKQMIMLELPWDFERRTVWHRTILTYTDLGITKASDKLVAIHGLAQQLEDKWDGVTYYAGLWSYRLRQDLLWYRPTGPSTRVCQEDDLAYRNLYPSWSWASINGKVNPTFEYVADGLVQILEVNMPSTSKSSLPTATRGVIKLRDRYLGQWSTPGMPSMIAENGLFTESLLCMIDRQIFGLSFTGIMTWIRPSRTPMCIWLRSKSSPNGEQMGLK